MNDKMKHWREFVLAVCQEINMEKASIILAVRRFCILI